MCSPPPETARKLQLAAEQSLTEGHWNPPKKIPPSKDKGAATMRWYEGHSLNKGWVTHKLQNYNTKEILPLLWRFWTPSQTSQLGGLAKEWGIPRESDLESQQHLIKGQYNSYQITNGFFHRAGIKILKFMQRHERPKIAKASLTKKTGDGGIRLPDFRLDYKDTVMKTVLYWNKNKKSNGAGMKTWK